MPQPPQQPESTPLVSGVSILIFSGFLIGVTVGRGVGGDLSPYVLSCGLAGVLAYVGFDRARAGKRERELLDERQLLLARLERHLTNSPSGDADADSSVQVIEPNQSPASAGIPQLADQR